MTCVNLIDSHHCSDPSKFLSVLLLSLHSMTQLELPHVNVLSKMDLIESLGPLQFGLEFYTDVLDLSYLIPQLTQAANASHPLSSKYSRLASAIAELVESYNLVSFVPLDVGNQELMAQCARLIDKANGFVYVASESKETGKGAAGAASSSSQQNAATIGAAAEALAAAQRARMLTATHNTQLDDVRMSVWGKHTEAEHRATARQGVTHAHAVERL